MTGYSGVELWTYDMALALRRAGHQVSVHAEFWEDHFKHPMLRSGVECCDLLTFPDCIEVNLSPKFGPYRSACVTGRPVVQVLHSEHLTDVPMKTPHPPRGVILIRRGQDFLLDIDPGGRDMPSEVIRNPVDLRRFDPGPDPLAMRYFSCVMLSEFDDMKAELAEQVQQRLGGEVLLVGPWRSELPVPPGCTHEQPTLDVAQAYARARCAFSYRLSRQFAEAISCGVPVLVRGDLEPAQVTRHDQDGVWHLFQQDDPAARKLALEFDADRVAAHVVRFCVDCIR
jgi:glycosyltransferase involved in cell wall biosynthesis